MVTCSKTPTTVTWSEHLKIYCRVIVTQQRPRVHQNPQQVSQAASAGKGADMSTGSTPGEFSLDLVILDWPSDFLQSMFLKKICCFFLIFQPFLTSIQLITWIVV